MCYRSSDLLRGPNVSPSSINEDDQSEKTGVQIPLAKIPAFHVAAHVHEPRKETMKKLRMGCAMRIS